MPEQRSNGGVVRHRLCILMVIKNSYEEYTIIIILSMREREDVYKESMPFARPNKDNWIFIRLFAPSRKYTLRIFPDFN